MAKEICISTTPHETRLAILEDDQLAEIYYERENEYTLAGSIYKGRVTRVLPGMQSSFVDVGLERDAFLYVTDFLEDSEDADEYETTTPGEGSRRERGGERGQDRSADRGGERQAAEEPSGEDRRGRREKGRQENRGEGRRGERAEAAPATPAAAERSAVTAALRTAQPTETDREAKGDEEEAPQGTRRWRGRRGRRRGGVRAGVLGIVAGTAETDELSQPATAPFDLPEHGAPGGLAASLAVMSEDAPENAARDAEPETFNLQASAAPVPELIRRERGGREGGRNRETRPVRDRSEIAAPAQTPTAIVLPGESISKYGGTPQRETSAQAEAKSILPSRPVNYVAPKPATQVDLQVTGWDGGSVLPGESLSRYRGQGTGSPAAQVVPQEVAAQEQAENLSESTQSASHPERPTEAAVAIEEALASAEITPPEIVAEALPGVPAPEQIATTAEPIDGAAQTEQAFAESEMAAETALEHIAESVSENLGEPDEYEPTDGQASVRLSPPTTSELRLSQLFGMGDGGSTREEKGTEREAPVPEPEDFISEHPVPSTPDAGVDPAMSEVPQQHAEVSSPEPVAGQAEPAVSAVTAEVWTEETTAEVTAETTLITETDHEDHFESAKETERHGSDDGFTQLVDQLQGFAPGLGELEEEVIDEDEYDFDPIHAQADEHDLEDLEEETLDGGHEFVRDSARDLEMEEPQEESPTLQMEEVAAHTGTLSLEQALEEEEPAAFAFHEVGEDEEDEPVGEPRREGNGEERSRRGGRNNGGRRRGVGGNGGGRRAQTQDLPIISDLLKQGQEILVQIAKEPIAKKGARITSHIALPGRFLVFMPTVHHVGVSRKIASDEERQRLKRILVSERGENTGGFIVRTAAEGASEEELRADLRFLISLWTEIKQRADTAKAPALIYHDLNLVERILRDQVSSNFSTIWVDTEQEYERIVRFLNRFQPSLVRRVKLYTKETPLFEHFGIQEEISKALKSKVWLKSGGSIVINQTEALVAIDINTGKYVGKTARLEDTIVKTNLDAIPEIVRQIRLRDLGGIIVIDFIDMDERKNRHRVLAALEEAMKADRAPSKVLQFNDFGLVAITRKRVKQSLERTLSVQCETCAGTGMVKSPVTVCNEIYIELRKMYKHLEGKDVMLRVHPEVVKQLKSANGRWINEYEEMIGKTVIIKSDPALHPEQFDIH